MQKIGNRLFEYTINKIGDKVEHISVGTYLILYILSGMLDICDACFFANAQVCINSSEFGYLLCLVIL